MADKFDLQLVLGFLSGLKENNNKPWFEAHRSDYQNARQVFERFIDALIDQFRVSDHLAGLSARDCIPRIYRDIRFSRDKSPYKTNLGAMIAPGGWNAGSQGYYVSIEPHGLSIVAGGLHNPSPDQLELFRQAISRDARPIKELTRANRFIELFGSISGERLKTAPKGYDRAHPEIGLLQLKQITAVHHFEDRQVLAGDFSDQVILTCRAMKPFLSYLSSLLQ